MHTIVEEECHSKRHCKLRYLRRLHVGALQIADSALAFAQCTPTKATPHLGSGHPGLVQSNGSNGLGSGRGSEKFEVARSKVRFRATPEFCGISEQTSFACWIYESGTVALECLPPASSCTHSYIRTSDRSLCGLVATQACKVVTSLLILNRN